MDNLPAVASRTAVTAADFLPVFDIGQAIERRNSMVEFVKQILVDKIDYGTIPGIDKPTLLQPGVEKLCSFFGLTPIMDLIDKTEDWTGKDHGGEPFFYYRYRCTLKRGDHVLGIEEASQNSWDEKYRWRWVSEDHVPQNLDKSRLLVRESAISEFEFAIMKGETTGQYGKPANYWKQFTDAMTDGSAVVIDKKTRKGTTMPAIQIGGTQYRIPNPEIFSQVNTIQQMAEKRAKTRATRGCTAASQFFTQDFEDMVLIDVMPAHASAGAAPTSADAPAQGQPPADAAKAGVAAAKAAAKPKKPAETVETAFDAAKTTAAAPAGDQDDAKLSLIEAVNIGQLTTVFNGFPVDWKRPNSPLHKLFMKRRGELSPAVTKGNTYDHDDELGGQA